MKQIHFLRTKFHEISAEITLESLPKIGKTFGAQILLRHIHPKITWHTDATFLNNRCKQNNKSHKINNVKCANYAYPGPNQLTDRTWKATRLDVTESQNSNILTVVNGDRSY